MSLGGAYSGRGCEHGTPCLEHHATRALGIHSARGAVAVAGSCRTGAAGALCAFDARRSSAHARRRAESALFISMMMVSFRLVERLEGHPDIARAFLTLQAMPCVAALAVIDLTATWYRVGCSAWTVYAQIRGQGKRARKRGWQRPAPQPLPPTLQGLPLPLACLAMVSAIEERSKGRWNRKRLLCPAGPMSG